MKKLIVIVILSLIICQQNQNQGTYQPYQQYPYPSYPNNGNQNMYPYPYPAYPNNILINIIIHILIHLLTIIQILINILINTLILIKHIQIIINNNVKKEKFLIFLFNNVFLGKKSII